MEKLTEKELQQLFGSSTDKLMETDPEFLQIIGNFMKKDVLPENKLTEKERTICILSVLIGCGGISGFKNILYTALNNGIEPTAVKEIIYQATAYLGIGRTLDFLNASNDVMELCNIKLPLELSSTTDENTRFEKGLEKQVKLFGKDMEKRQTDSPILRRNINRWLASNCFGDYYTRMGLNDREREMITFCFILAQGGCENQLRGHVAGNLAIGNNKEILHSIVEQCMPFIGYPRSLNAMNIIDEITSKTGK